MRVEFHLMLDRMEGAVLLLHSFFQVTQFNKLGVKLLVLRALKREGYLSANQKLGGTERTNESPQVKREEVRHL